MKKPYAVLLAVLLLTAGCEKLESQVEQLRDREKDTVLKVKTVNAYVLEPKQGGLTQEITGTVVPQKELPLSFGSSGKIAKIFVQKGSAVKTGELLAALDTTVWQQEIDAAQSQVDRAALQRAKTLKGAHETDVTQQKLKIERARQNLAKASDELNRGKLLFQNGAISKEELDTATLAQKQAAMSLQEEELSLSKLVEAADKLDVEAADAQVKEAAAQLGRANQDLKQAQLHAPFGGIVAAIPMQESEQVGAGTEVVRLIDPSSWMVKIQVENDQIGNWKKGQAVTVVIPGGEELGGQVSFVSPILDQATATYPVEIAVKGDVADWKAGMTVTCRYDVKGGNALLVPVSAVGISDESHYVMKLAEDTIQKTEIQVGSLYGEYYQVLSGLEAGDRIVSQGLSYVLDGETVRVADDQ
ncbi:UNVERIFIED_CONTAM: HlyD family secretion protein [Brevibacillus sp. OAP136]